MFIIPRKGACRVIFPHRDVNKCKKQFTQVRFPCRTIILYTFFNKACYVSVILYT